MSLPVVLSLLWLAAAVVLAVLPSRHGPGARVWALIAVGVPLLGWATVRHGPLVGLILLAVGALVLRWPVIRPLRRAGTG